MNILYVYAHPNQHSFNAKLKDIALCQIAKLNHTLNLSDLYAENFNPIASWQDFNMNASPYTQYFLAQQEAFNKHALTKDIETEINKIKTSDHLIFQFPLWWFSVPAILKGWFDRIWVKGFAYDTGKVFKEGLLKDKTASLIVTAQSPQSAYQLDGMHGAKMENFLAPIHHTLRFVGITTLKPFIIYNAFNIESDREKQIEIDFQQHLITLLKSK